MLNADGVLWAGVKGGLWRYDGSGWESVAGVTRGVSVIHESRDGVLWVGGYGGLWRYDGSSWELRLMGDLVRSRLSMKVETVRSRLVEGMDCGVKRVLAKMRSGFILIWLITI